MTPDPLADLRDIHLPPDPGWWPPAPGWWLLATLLTLTLVALVLHWRRGRVRRQQRREALDELRELPNHYQLPAQAPDFLNHLSVLLRRVAIAVDGPRAAGLSGERWSSYLCDHATGAYDPTVFRQIALLPYRPQARVDNPDLLLRQTRQWVEYRLR